MPFRTPPPTTPAAAAADNSEGFGVVTEQVVNGSASTLSIAVYGGNAGPVEVKAARAKILAANLRGIRHPYYSAYTGLQKICIQIIRHEKISFGQSEGGICGIVFDAAWLWEEYLNTVFGNDKMFAGAFTPKQETGDASVFL